MIRALKVTLIVYGAILVLGGLADIFIPDQIMKLMGVGEIAGYVRWLAETLGAIRVAAGVWVVNAARDPLRHISWVKFGITEGLMLVVINLYSVIKGYIDFMQVAPLTILAAVVTVALLVFYPWRIARVAPQVPASKP